MCDFFFRKETQNPRRSSDDLQIAWLTDLKSEFLRMKVFSKCGFSVKVLAKGLALETSVGCSKSSDGWSCASAAFGFLCSTWCFKTTLSKRGGGCDCHSLWMETRNGLLLPLIIE